MRMKLLGSEDTKFEQSINGWLGENPGIEIRHVTAFPNGEGGRWFQIMIFFDERPNPQRECSPLELQPANSV